MAKQHHYNALISWTGNTGAGTQSYGAYKRDFKISIDSKVDIECSSDPAFRGDKTKHNPEEMLLAAVSSCHMLFYLHLCADSGIVVVSYKDNASGIMQETADGGGYFTEIILKPEIVITNGTQIALAESLHKKANQLCFIANSLNFKVKHEPLINHQ
jgi:organic hydroperoxide reductase OsmC/OhrA